jgi:DNA invertase Pin-like site-specific DNA recombinase
MEIDMLIGYARVSTQDQNLKLQLDALKNAGCDRIFEEKVSAVKANRIELARALDILRTGDTLCVWKLDRLGRSVKDLVNLVTELLEKGIQFKSVTDSIDTSTPSGRFFFNIIASLSQMERELLIERTRAGLTVARSAGRIGGRKRLMTQSKLTSAKKLLASGTSVRDVAESVGVSVPTLYRWIPANFDVLSVEARSAFAAGVKDDLNDPVISSKTLADVFAKAKVY